MKLDIDIVNILLRKYQGKNAISDSLNTSNIKIFYNYYVSRPVIINYCNHSNVSIS